MSTGFAPARIRPSRGAAAPSRERETETFTAPAARDGNRLRNRLSWPLGIYTTPVAILVLWQLTSELGWVAAVPTYQERVRLDRP